jgi:Tol biopolymer transport system component
VNVTDFFGEDNNPIWSPDGRFLAFEVFGNQRNQRLSRLGGGGKAIYVMDINNRNRTWRATPRNMQAQEPSWAADGNYLAVAGRANNQSTNDIFVVSIYDQDFQQITDTPNLVEYGPSFSPDGLSLAFGLLNQSTQIPDGIFVVPYRERGLRLIAQREELETEIIRISDFPGAGSPAWTQDGDVLFTYNAGTLKQLHTSNPTENAPDLSVSNVQVFMENPSLSPDGQWVVFSSATSSGEFWRALYIMRPDGTDIRRITFGNEGANAQWRDINPSWRPVPTSRWSIPLAFDSANSYTFPSSSQ